MFKYEIGTKVFVDYYEANAVIKDRRVESSLFKDENMYLVEFESHFEPDWVSERYLLHYFDSGETLSDIQTAIHGTKSERERKEEYIVDYTSSLGSIKRQLKDEDMTKVFESIRDIAQQHDVIIFTAQRTIKPKEY